MSDNDSRREHPSTYFIPVKEFKDERERLQLQDQLITTAMGGVLPEHPEIPPFRRVLDTGCGTGGWLIELAKAHPEIPFLAGADVSEHMVEFAREQAELHQVSDRVQFHIMDSLRMLEFPSNFFDLVNQRMAVGYLRTWDWPKLLREFLRITRPGGIVRLTEGHVVFRGSNSEALTILGKCMVQALHQGGHLFNPDDNGPYNEVARLLRQYGFENVQTRPVTLEYRAGTPAGQLFYEDLKIILRNLAPFLRRLGKLPDNYDELYQQGLHDAQQEGFYVMTDMITAWGYKPQK